MEATVIIVSYRPGDWLRDALESARSQASHVVLVDNGSVDKEASRLGHTAGAEVVALHRNLGFASGVNAGLTRVRGDVVALLNDDAVAEPGWIATSIDALERSGAAAVAPKLLLGPAYAEVVLDEAAWHAPGDPRPLGRCLYGATTDGDDVLPDVLGGIHAAEHGLQGGVERSWRWTSAQRPLYLPVGRPGAALELNGEVVVATRIVDLVNNAGSYLSAEGHGGDYGHETPDDGQFDRAVERFAACGAALVARRDVFDQLGGFADEFFAYYEDLDWCWRLRLAGFRVVYEPRAVARHRRGATSGGKDAPSVARLAERNRILTLARNAPVPVAYAQVRRLTDAGRPGGVSRSVLKRMPRALGQRAALRRHWRVTPRDVFDQWAGVDERWPTQSAVDDSHAAVSATTESSPESWRP